MNIRVIDKYTKKIQTLLECPLYKISLCSTSLIFSFIHANYILSNKKGMDSDFIWIQTVNSFCEQIRY